MTLRSENSSLHVGIIIGSHSMVPPNAALRIQEGLKKIIRTDFRTLFQEPHTGPTRLFGAGTMVACAASSKFPVVCMYVQLRQIHGQGFCGTWVES